MRLVLKILAALLLVGCASETGVPACDTYLTDLRRVGACATAPADLRKMSTDAQETGKDGGWQLVGAAGCKAGDDALRRLLAAAGCK
jgi:hypothetical protein